MGEKLNKIEYERNKGSNSGLTNTLIRSECIMIPAGQGNNRKLI